MSPAPPRRRLRASALAALVVLPLSVAATTAPAEAAPSLGGGTAVSEKVAGTTRATTGPRLARRPARGATAAAGSATAVTLVPADGAQTGRHRLSGAGSRFPIGVWLESVVEPGQALADRAAGINTYVAITANSDLDLVPADMDVVAQQDEWRTRHGTRVGAPVDGWLVGDEIDMTHGPEKGTRLLDGIVAGLPKDGRVRYGNYGKGITFWQTDEQARRFVNRYQDVVSADTYWFTDPNICGRWEGGALLRSGTRALSQAECRMAANYGDTVRRVRSLVQPARSKPVWNFVELGHPFTEEHAPTIRPAEVSAAVWSGIIAGARGVVYFNHSFGGPCQTQHALREPCYAAVRTAVTETNRRVQALAPALAAPTALGYATADGAVDVLVKHHQGAYYVLAGSSSRSRQTVTFTLACPSAGTVQVLDEGRSLRVSGRTFSDVFADGNAVHVYKLPDAGCAPRG